MNRRNLLSAIPALLSTGFLSSLSFPARADSSVIRFGQSASISGGQASYGKDVRDGINAAFHTANKTEANKGLHFELITLDDGGDKERCKQNTKTLIDSGVSALIGYTSGAGAEAALTQIEAAQIVLLGTASGNMGIRNNTLTMPYHIRAGYDEEYAKLASFIKEFGMKRVAYVHLKDTSAANQTAMDRAMSNAGIEPALRIALDRNLKNFDEDAEKILNGNIDSILFTTNAGPIVAITDYLTSHNFGGFSFSSSFAGQSLIEGLNNKKRSIIMSQVVLNPKSIGNPLIKGYHESMAAIGASERIGYTSLEAYIAGLVSIEATRVAMKGEAGLSRSRFKKALSGLNSDLGGYKVNFSSGTMQGSHFTEVVTIAKNGRIVS